MGRIVYLGGLGDESTSKHLAARHDVAAVLAAEGPPLTYFRAAMVIGPGSESYELLRAIVERLPVLPGAGLARDEDAADRRRRRHRLPAGGDRRPRVGRPRDPDRRPGRRHPPRRRQRDGERAWAQAAAPHQDVRPRSRAPRPSPPAPARSPTATPDVAVEISLGLTTPTIVTDPSGAKLFTTHPHRIDAVLAEAIDGAWLRCEPQRPRVVVLAAPNRSGSGTRSWTRPSSSAG